jgi:hypothetical protein
MALDNVPTFQDDQALSAEDLTALGSSLSQKFTSGIQTTDILWPMVAGGILDMNGNNIVNIGSLSGVYHVNSNRSLATAVTAVNAAGGGTIVIDSDFDATTTAGGLEITAADVTIMGYGDESTLSMDGTSVGLTISGANFTIRNLSITGTSPISIQVNADNFKMVNVKDTSAGRIVLGSASNTVTGAEIVGNTVNGTADYVIELYNSIRARIEGNYITATQANGACILVSASGSTITDTIINGNLLVTTSTTGNALLSNLTAGVAAKRGMVMTGNILYNTNGAYSVLTYPEANRLLLTGNQIRGISVISGDNVVISGNWHTYDAYYHDVFNFNITGNQYEQDVYLGYDGSSIEDGSTSVFSGNSVYDDLIVQATGNPGFDVIRGNRVNGDESSLERLVTAGYVKSFSSF